MKKISYTVQNFKEKHAICGYILFFYTAHIIEKDGIILIIGALIPLKCVDDFFYREFVLTFVLLFCYIFRSAAIATAPLVQVLLRTSPASSVGWRQLTVLGAAAGC
jgi:hypothetical protein